MTGRPRIITAVFGAGLFVSGAIAQAPAQAPNKAENGKMCGMMSDKMGGMSPGDKMNAQMPLKMEQGDTARLADQLAASIAVIQAEKDPAALRQQLAEHAALIKELQSKLQPQHMQHNMGDMPNMPKN
jgi:hypothetical protein